MESLLKVRSHCTSDPHEGSRQTRAFVVCSLLGVRSVPNMECLSRCPKVQSARTNRDYLRSHRRGERAAAMDSPPPFSPTRTSVFSLLFITFPTITKHLLHLLCQTRAQAPGVRTDISHGWGMAYECPAPVTVSQQALTRGSACPLLLHRRLSPPTPDFFYS